MDTNNKNNSQITKEELLRIAANPIKTSVDKSKNKKKNTKMDKRYNDVYRFIQKLNIVESEDEVVPATAIWLEYVKYKSSNMEKVIPMNWFFRTFKLFFKWKRVDSSERYSGYNIQSDPFAEVMEGGLVKLRERYYRHLRSVERGKKTRKKNKKKT